MINKIKIILLINSLFFSLSFSQSWETIGGNSARTSFLNVVGPQEKPEILWEGSIYSEGGNPILISDNKIVTMRVVDPSLENVPILCHDLFTGDTLWSLDFAGGYHSMSVPMGFKNNVVYAINWLETMKDTLYAINADNGAILWRSTFGIAALYITGLVFTKNNDIIAADLSNIARINHKDGDTLWCVERHTPGLAWVGLTLFDDIIYGWEGVVGTEFSIIAINAETGVAKYKKAVPSVGTVNLHATTIPVVSMGKIIYALRPENNLVALKDNGDSLSILWSIPIINGGNSKPAIGTDGSVYFTNHKRIMRAEPLKGNIVDSSIIIQSEAVQHQNGYFAIDATGTVYFSNNTYNGILFSFTNDLQLIWADSIKGLNYGGPALGPHGLLAVAGADNILRVYKPENLAINNQISFNFQPQVSHITSPKYVSFRYYVQYYTNVRLILYNTRGQLIYAHENMPNSPGYHCENIKDINENYGNGRFIYQLIIGNKSISNTISIVK